MRMVTNNLRFLFFILVFFLIQLGLSTPLYSAEVKTLLKNHRYDKAIKELERKLKEEKHSKDPDILYTLGKTYHKRGLIYMSFFEVAKEMQRHYYEFLREYGVKTYLPFYLGVCYFEKGQYQKALKEFNDFNKTKNQDETYRLLSSVWIEASKFKLGHKDAFVRLEEIKIKNQNNPAVVSEVAYFLSYLQNENEKALRFIQGIRPPAELFESRFYRNLTYIYMKNNMFQELEKVSQLLKPENEEFIAEISPQLKIYFYDLSAIKILALIDFYLSDQALSQITEDKVSHELWQQVLYFRGQDAFYLGDYPRAVDLSEQSEHPVAKVFLGSAYYKLGQKPKAITIWGEVEKTENCWAIRELGRQYVFLNADPGKAVNLCQYALELAEEKYKDDIGHKIKYFRYLGWTYVHNGDSNEAVRAFEEGYDQSLANDLDFYEPEFLNERAFCLYKRSKSNWSEAIETYFVLLERYLAAKQIHYALQGLAAGQRTMGEVKIN